MDGYAVDTGDLRAQANRDLSDADELNGAATDLYRCDGPASSGARDSADLQSAMEYALDLFRNVFWEFSDAAKILGSAERGAAASYDQAEATSSALYHRMSTPLEQRPV